MHGGIFKSVHIFSKEKLERERKLEREKDRKSYVVVGRVVVVHFMKIMSQASLFARDKVSSCVLYCGRRCVPRASPLEFPATHFFSYSNRAPKQRDNECTQQPCRRPPVRFCFRFSRPYLSQIPAGVARERWRKRERERERSGSSLIIHHRVQPGETKMAALLPSANTLSSKEDSPRKLSRSRPPRSGLTTTLFARPLSLFFFFPSASKRVVRASRTPTRIINFLRSMIRKIRGEREEEKGKEIDTRS